MTQTSLWQHYSAEVLNWQLGQPPASSAHGLSGHANTADTERAAARLLRMAEASGRPLLLLMGMGDGALAARLHAAAPDHVRIVEACPHRARAVLGRYPQLLSCLLLDTSPWALLLLALDAGLTPDNCTLGRGARSAEVHAADDSLRTLEQWRKCFCGSTREHISPSSAAPPRISVGAILHPREPRLPDFFHHLPPWLHELCVVWDGEPPAALPPCPVPLRQHVRPLAGDFSAQRNAMLALCGGDWCLYLDADERLTPEAWSALPSLTSVAGAGSVFFPRLTFEGSEARLRMGYGLWPDIQCRFFPLSGGVHFQGSIHEQVHGLAGSALLAPGLPILHYSHVHKDRRQVEEKLRVFDAAAGSALHVSSAAYPSLPADSLYTLSTQFGVHSALRLPQCVQ